MLSIGIGSTLAMLEVCVLFFLILRSLLISHPLSSLSQNLKSVQMVFKVLLAYVLYAFLRFLSSEILEIAWYSHWDLINVISVLYPVAVSLDILPSHSVIRFLITSLNPVV
jgi:hypothetical protein